MGEAHIELFGSAMFTGTGRIRAQVTVEAEAAPLPDTNSLGLPVSRQFRITASALSGSEQGSYHWELSDSAGNVLADGIGDALTDALLGLAVGVESSGESHM